MDISHLTPFERSLMGTLHPPAHNGLTPAEGEDTLLLEGLDSYRHLTETLTVRKQIDCFLGGAGRIEDIAALLLTIITVGDLFAYNRALLLLTDTQDGHIRGYAGIGTLSREETWNMWSDILSEKPGLEDLVQRAVENFREHNERLAPLLERLVVAPGQSDRAALGFLDVASTVLHLSSPPDGSEWIFEALGTDKVGIIPMWGYYGHFGVLLIDNFASDRPISSEGVQLLEGFIKPFISALEKALIIERHRNKVAQLQEAKALIEAQQEMLLRMERKNTVDRFTATLAHNLLNPVLSMSGHLAKLSEPGVERRRHRQLLQALHGDLRDLEEFMRDFISQVQSELPQRHFWDLNHLIGEVISSYHRFHNILTPDIIFEEGDIPLVRLDYEKVTDCLSRVMGIADYLTGGMKGMTISTFKDGAFVSLIVEVAEPFSFPPGKPGEQIRKEVDRLKEYLGEEEIGLTQGRHSFTLVFRA